MNKAYALLQLCEDIRKVKLKVPKGYKVNVRAVEKSSAGNWYDYQVFNPHGTMCMYSSGTMFEDREKCKAHGVESAMIIAGELPDRMDFAAWKSIEIIS